MLTLRTNHTLNHYDDDGNDDDDDDDGSDDDDSDDDDDNDDNDIPSSSVNFSKHLDSGSDLSCILVAY